MSEDAQSDFDKKKVSSILTFFKVCSSKVCEIRATFCPLTWSNLCKIFFKMMVNYFC